MDNHFPSLSHGFPLGRWGGHLRHFTRSVLQASQAGGWAVGSTGEIKWGTVRGAGQRSEGAAGEGKDPSSSTLRCEHQRHSPG